LIGSLIISRSLAALFQFVCSKFFVFKSRGKIQQEARRFLMLFLVMSFLSIGLTNYASTEYNIYPVTVKLCVELLLYFTCFFMMRVFVFGNSTFTPDIGVKDEN